MSDENLFAGHGTIKIGILPGLDFVLTSLKRIASEGFLGGVGMIFSFVCNWM